MLELDSFFEVVEETTNKENDDLTSERMLKASFVELCKAGCTIQTLCDYLKQKKGITWTDEESSCAIVCTNNNEDLLPTNLDYSVELIVSTTASTATKASEEGEEVEPTPSTTTTTTIKLQVVSKDSDSSSATIQGLILLCAASSSSSSSSSSSTTDVTLKCFARNPRQVLPTFHPESFLQQQQEEEEDQQSENLLGSSNLKLSSLKF